MPLSGNTASALREQIRRILPPELPVALRWAAGAYLLHILSVGRIALAESLFGIAFLATLVALRRRELTIRPDPIHFALQLFVAGSLLSALTSRNPLVSLSDLGDLVWLSSIPLGVALVGAVPGFAIQARRALLVLSVFLSLYGIGQFFILGYGWKNVEHRITGPAPHVMTYSGIILAVALYFCADALATRRYSSVIGALLPSLALALTLTRGAWIGWGIGVGALLLRRAPRAFLWAVPAAILALSFAPLPIFARVVSVFDLRQESNFDRIRMAKAGMEMIRDEPLTGMGPREVRALYPLYRLPDAPRFAAPHLHSNPIQIWAERGIVAMTGYLLLIGILLVRCWRVPRTDSRRRAADCGLAVTVGMTVAGLFEYNFGDAEVLLTLLSIMALTIGELARTPTPDAAGASPSREAAC